VRERAPVGKLAVKSDTSVEEEEREKPFTCHSPVQSYSRDSARSGEEEATGLSSFMPLHPEGVEPNDGRTLQQRSRK
jgi:hypothetical protein